VVLSYLAIPSTVIHHAGCTYRASGLRAVITHPLYRHHGYGRQIVTAARAVIAASGADLGMFTCDPPLVAFFVQSGWMPMEHTAIIGREGLCARPADSLGKCTLTGFFSKKARRHRRDFVGASLYLNLREGDLW